MSREQTDVASSETSIRCVFANSENMLLGWSEDVGRRSSVGRSPSMIAGCARSVESYTVYAFLNQVALRASSPKPG